MRRSRPESPACRAKPSIRSRALPPPHGSPVPHGGYHHTHPFQATTDRAGRALRNSPLPDRIPLGDTMRNTSFVLSREAIPNRRGWNRAGSRRWFSPPHARVNAESTGGVLPVRVYNMIDDPGMKETLQFLIAWAPRISTCGWLQLRSWVATRTSTGTGRVIGSYVVNLAFSKPNI